MVTFSFYVLLSLLTIDHYDKCERGKYMTWVVNPVICTAYAVPIATIVESIGKCSTATKKNCCIGCAKCLSFCSLFLIFIAVIPGFSVAIYYLVNAKCGKDVFYEIMYMTIAFTYMPYFYFGVLNWVLISWKGCCCLPVFPPACACECLPTNCIDEESGGCPRPFCPMLTCSCMNLLLKCYYMGEETYYEEKKKFQEEYPGLLTIDQDCFNGSVDKSEHGVISTQVGVEIATTGTSSRSPKNNTLAASPSSSLGNIDAESKFNTENPIFERFD